MSVLFDKTEIQVRNLRDVVDRVDLLVLRINKKMTGGTKCRAAPGWMPPGLCIMSLY